ncbi:hypothetical protein [Blautia producta]|uniref:hypothetical protein n=1 Tax=Blautia producta TaxID=33035 RepID=UPI0031B59561
MKTYDEYLYKKVRIVCTDGSEFTGSVDSFGGSVQGKEEYGRAEDFLSVYTGESSYVLFQSEIKDIVEL